MNSKYTACFLRNPKLKSNITRNETYAASLGKNRIQPQNIQAIKISHLEMDFSLAILWQLLIHSYSNYR